MNKITNFEKKVKEKKDDSEDKVTFKLPNATEVMAFNQLANMFNENEMVDIKMWCGSCWESFFNKVIKEAAEKEKVEQWDMFATVVAMMLSGLKFEKINDSIQMTIGNN